MVTVNLRNIPYLSSSIHHFTHVPQKWADDIKHLEFDELLSSSAGTLALIFRWKKAEKNEFVEIASGSLASSFVYGDPLSALASIAALGYSYSKSKNKFNFRRFKWAAIRGGVGVAAFALSTKLISVTLLNFLVGILAAAAARKIIGALRWFEYMKFLKSLRKVIPVLKKEMSRREFLSLQMFTLKRA